MSEERFIAWGRFAVVPYCRTGSRLILIDLYKNDGLPKCFVYGLHK